MSEMNIRNLKKEALRSLKGNWFTAIITYFVGFSIILGTALLVYVFEILLLKEIFKKGLILFVNLLCSLLISLISSSVIVGMYAVYMKISRKEKVTFLELFKGFCFFPKAFILTFVNNLTILFGTLFFIVPGIILTYNYSMTYFILIDNPDWSIAQIRAESTHIMIGKRWKLFCLELSFIGWILLAIVTCGLSTFFVVPYMINSILCFYEDLDKNFHLETKFNINEDKKIFDRVTKREFSPRNNFNNPFR